MTPRSRLKPATHVKTWVEESSQQHTHSIPGLRALDAQYRYADTKVCVRSRYAEEKPSMKTRKATSSMRPPRSAGSCGGSSRIAYDRLRWLRWLDYTVARVYGGSSMIEYDRHMKMSMIGYMIGYGGSSIRWLEYTVARVYGGSSIRWLEYTVAPV
jgi:hypothetical protein